MRIPKEGDKIMLNDSTYREWAVFIQREGHDISQDGTIIRIDGEPVDSYTVERDYVFGMGDNRNNSEDSRYWGFVPKENVVGSPIMVYWSWENRELVQVPGGYAMREKSLGEKLGSIRWGRIFKGIN
jgi:signal peptidase I